MDTVVVSLSLGYFLFDTIAGIVYRFNDSFMFLHHVSILILIIHNFYSDKTIAKIKVAYILGEISGPFLNLLTICTKYEY